MPHLRFDSTNSQHTKMTLFTRGANNGQLTLDNEEAVWLYHIIKRGCEELGFDFLASGHGPNPRAKLMDKCAQDMNTIEKGD